MRQINHRAREHVAARRPRVHVNPAEQRAAVERFLAILNSGDIQSLLDVLAPDVVLVADGGGRVAAARHPIEGASRVVEFLSRFARIASRADGRIVWLNGAPAVLIDLDGELDTAVSLDIEGRTDFAHLRGPQPGQAHPPRGRAPPQPDSLSRAEIQWKEPEV